MDQIRKLLEWLGGRRLSAVLLVAGLGLLALYASLDHAAGFGVSAAAAKGDRTRAMETELARSIESINAVLGARVHIVDPGPPFSAGTPPATAAVTLRTGGRLAEGQVEAIRYLVAAAVPGLVPERISIVDQSGTLLARAGDPDGGDLSERQTEVQARLSQKIETMLGAIVGPDHVHAEVAAELDPDQLRRESQTFDPDLQVVARTAMATDRNSAAAEPSEETVYSNSSTKTTLVHEPGTVMRLTVSVMVDGSYEDAGGDLQYRPRTAAEIARFTRLVENAIGYDEMRGDSVVVENLRFAQAGAGPAVPAAAAGFDLAAMPLLRLGILGLLGICALAVILRWLGGPGAARKARLVPAPPARDDEAIARPTPIRGPAELPAIEQEIDVAQVEGRLKSSTLRKVGEVVEARPSEATAIVRQWMYS